MIRIAVVTGVLAALACAPAAFALTPEPLPWYTCRPAGQGTICQGSNTQAYGPVDTEISCGAFDIYDSGRPTDRATRWYDADGNLTRRLVHTNEADGHFSNPLTGARVSYTQTVSIDDVLGVPGDLSSATETNVGENIYRDADSRIVFRSVGRFVTSPTGEIEFRSGIQNFLDVFVDGNAAVLEPLCAALGG
jgi:hypothetical protein